MENSEIAINELTPDQIKDIEIHNLLFDKGIFAKSVGGAPVITGKWLWVQFEGKPSPDIREKLKNEGFKFAFQKKLWYFAAVKVGRSKGMDMDYIKNKYGNEEL